MPLTIRSKDPRTKVEQVYTVPDYEEMTIAHYKRLSPIPEGVFDLETDFAKRIECVSKMSGIPVKVLENRPMKEVQAVFDLLQDDCIKAITGSENFAKNLEEDNGYIPPQFLTIGGVEYAVPYDLEMETVGGQWADWSRWDPPEHEADLIAETLAFMLVRKGKKYAGAGKAHIAAMMDCNLSTAFDLCAFFFAKSERFRNATNQRRRSFQTSLSVLQARVLRLSPSDTEGSTSSTGLLK